MGSPDPLITFRRVPERAGLQREQLELFAKRLSCELAGGRVFHCRIAGDGELRRLNRDYLGHDYPTDVLSFPAFDSSMEDGYLGDLAISRHRAAAYSRRFGHGITEEIQLLLLHGVLHLLGYDHETDRGRMARAERKWRERLGLPSSLLTRCEVN